MRLAARATWEAGGEAATHGGAISRVATHGAASVELGWGVRD